MKFPTGNILTGVGSLEDISFSQHPSNAQHTEVNHVERERSHASITELNAGHTTQKKRIKDDENGATK